MKEVERIYQLLFLFLTGLLTALQSQAATEPGTQYFDSVEIGLVTCTPHEEIYSLYGHTSLRVRNFNSGEDLSFNYGVFNYSQDYFVLRFVLGKTDYELGVTSFPHFCEYYKRWGSRVSEQVLNLNAEEKRAVIHALAVNCQPQNRVYRYNFFYDNCATRPRDIIEHNLQGKINYEKRKNEHLSFRQMIAAKTALHPWATAGNDLLLGFKADLSTTPREQQFLPENLESDFDNAIIIGNDGSMRPLVKERRELVAPGAQRIEEGFPLSPMACAIMLLALSLLVFMQEWRRRSCLVWWDALLMLCFGLAGCLITVMLFSEHPATSTNLQVLLFNPLHLLFIPAVVRRKPTRYWQLLLLLLLLLFVGSFIQQYAEGVYFLALCLLLRFCSHKRNDK